MPRSVSHTSSPVPTSALCLDLTKVAAASNSASPASARTCPLASENGLSAVSGPLLCRMRTMGAPWAAAPSIKAFWAAR